MCASTFMRPCAVWLDSETCSRARRGESTLGERCSRHNDTSSVSEGCSLTVSMVWASSSEDAASLEPTSPSCREDRFRHRCCDHMDECAFSLSVVARSEVSVSMSSFCCSPHKQLVASTYSTSAHETSQLLRKDVEFNTLISRLGDRLRGSPRRLHGHLRHPLSARTGFRSKT